MSVFVIILFLWTRFNGKIPEVLGSFFNVVESIRVLFLFVEPLSIILDKWKLVHLERVFDRVESRFFVGDPGTKEGVPFLTDFVRRL